MEPTTRRGGKMVDTFLLVFLALTLAAVGVSLPVDDTSKCQELSDFDAPKDLPQDGTVYLKAARGGDASAILNMHKMVNSRHSTPDDSTSLCNATLTAEHMSGDWERVMFSVKQMAYPPTQEPSQYVSSSETSSVGTYDDDSASDEPNVSQIPDMTVMVIVAGDMVQVCMEPKGSNNDERKNENEDHFLRVHRSVNITWCLCHEGASPWENDGQQTTIPDEQPTQTTLQGGNTTENNAHDDETWKYLTIVLILVLIFVMGGFCMVKLYRQMRKNLGKKETLVTYNVETEETNKNPRAMSMLTAAENHHQSHEPRPPISTGMNIGRNSVVPSASPDVKISPSPPPLTLPSSPPPPPRPSYIPPPPQLEIIQANNDDNHYDDDDNDYDYIDLNVFKEQMEKERLEREGKAKLMMKEIEIMNLDRYDSVNSLYEEFKSNDMNKDKNTRKENGKAEGYGSQPTNKKPRPNLPGYESDQDDDGYEKIDFRYEPKQGEDEKRMQNYGNKLNDDENTDKGEQEVNGVYEDGQGNKSSDEDEQDYKSNDGDEQEDGESSDEDEHYNKSSDEDEQSNTSNDTDDHSSDEDEQDHESSDEDDQNDKSRDIGDDDATESRDYDDDDEQINF